MHRAKPVLAILCVFQMISPTAGLAADQGFFSRFTRNYRPSTVAPNNLSNSTRIDSLLRGGNLYLSLDDAIALALENNIDISIQRYNPQLADVAVMQAQAGGNARGVSTTISGGPQSANISATGTTPGNNQNAVSQASQANASALGGSVIQGGGPAIPSLDPVLTGGASWGHITSPQSNSFITGNSALVTRQTLSSVGISKGFLTGTTVTLGLNNTAAKSNNPRNDFNPSQNASLGISITQRLLQGFGPSINSRQITIAKNNREVSDLTFKLQVITTVAAVMNLYWDLVAFNENVRVARDAVATATRLLEDNKRQVEVGTLAPIEVTRAEAQIALGQQQLSAATLQVLQQETILKNALSRTGVSNPAIQAAHIIPTDQIRVPDVEPISPIQDLMAMAISSRPEMAQSRIQIQNQELTIRGSKNALKPSLDAFVSTSNSGLAGQPNELPPPPGTVHTNNPFFLGGYGDVLQQLFARNFPNYSAGFNMTIPLRNRTAQAQVISDQLTLRQQQLGLQRLENQIRVDVQNAQIALTQARAFYQTAVRQHALQAQTLDAEQKKLALGATAIYNVIQDTQALTLAESNEVAAKASYAKAKVEMDRATGQILSNHNISIEEAFRGTVSRPPSTIPPGAGSASQASPAAAVAEAAKQ